MLTRTQQEWATKAVELVNPCISYFLDSYPCLRGVLSPDDLESAALFACTTAASTYDPARAGISAYFSRAIIHEILKSCKREIRSGNQSVYRISLRAAEIRMPVRRREEGADAEMLALLAQAFSALSEEDRRWLRSHAVDGMSVRTLAKQENMTTRQAAKLLRAKFSRLRKSLPVPHDPTELSPAR